ncbi:centrosomal protein of 152 kDa isoform X4 [Takifugu rubripes]|uniref:centrosomal protein of 152 kDa isoform X4 n=1 Tax=Takifugu rubripes TaxID=31033 RepID=UPI001145C6B0|nr:centrosomal protein of 152 kDa isoform X4 [Takifugu rubripes]
MSIDFDSAALQTQHDEEEYDQEDYAREQELQKLLTDLPDDMLEDSRDSSPELDYSTCSNKNTTASPQSTRTPRRSADPRSDSQPQYEGDYDNHSPDGSPYETGGVQLTRHQVQPQTWSQTPHDHQFNPGEYSYTSVGAETNEFSTDEYASQTFPQGNNNAAMYNGEGRGHDQNQGNDPRNPFQGLKSGPGDGALDPYKATYNPHRHVRQPPMFNVQATRQDAQLEQLQREFLESTQQTAAGEQLAQLQILNKAHQRQIEDLERKLEDSRRNMRYVEHQHAIVKDEKDGLKASLKDSNRLIEEAKQREVQLQSRLNSLEQQVNVLTGRDQESVKKLRAAEAAVDSLKQQVVELCRSDTLSKAREQHDRDLAVTKEQHAAALLRLHQKVDSTCQGLNEQIDVAQSLREQLQRSERQREEEQLERARVVNGLAQRLEESQQQCAKLLQTSSVQETTQLQIKVQQAEAAKALSENMNKDLQEDLADLKEQINLYENAVRYGVIGLDQSEEWENHLSESCVDLGLKKAKRKNGLHGKAVAHLSDSKMPKDEGLRLLRVEMQRCLGSLKGKRQKISQLHEELRLCRGRVNELQSQMDEAKLSATVQESSQLKNPEASGESKKELLRLQEDQRRLQEQLELLEKNNKELKQSEEKLKSTNLELCTKMREMIQELDQEKQEASLRAERINQQHRDDVVSRVRAELMLQHDTQVEQLAAQHQQQVQQLQTELSEANDKLLAVQECYLSVCREKDALEERVRAREQQEEKLVKEKEQKIREEGVIAMEKLRAALEAQHQASLNQMKSLWCKEKETEVQLQMEKTWEQRLEEVRREKCRETAEATCQAAEPEASRGTVPVEELDIRLRAQKQQLLLEADKVKHKAVEEARRQTQRQLHKKNLEDMAKQVEGAVTRAYNRWIQDLTSLPEYQASLQREKEKWEQGHKELAEQRSLSEAEKQKEQLEEQSSGTQRMEQLQEEVADLQTQLEQVRQEQAALMQAELAGARATWNRDKQQELAAVRARMEQAHQGKLLEQRRALEQVLQQAREDAASQQKEMLLQMEARLQQTLESREEEWRRESSAKEETQRGRTRGEMLAELQAALADVQAQLKMDPKPEQQDVGDVGTNGGTEDTITRFIKTSCRDIVNAAVSQAKEGWRRISEDRLGRVLKETQQHYELELSKVQNSLSQRKEPPRCRKECPEMVGKLQRKNQELQRHLEKACRQLQHCVQEHKSAVQRLKDEHESSLQMTRVQHLQQLEEAKRATETAESSEQQKMQEGLEEMKQQYLSTVEKIRGRWVFQTNRLLARRGSALLCVAGDVMLHLQESRERAAEVIQAELQRERRDTARTMRHYYLSCLQELLEDGGKSTGAEKKIMSAASKLAAMAKVLETPVKGKPGKIPRFQSGCPVLNLPAPTDQPEQNPPPTPLLSQHRTKPPTGSGNCAPDPAQTRFQCKQAEQRASPSLCPGKRGGADKNSPFLGQEAPVRDEKGASWSLTSSDSDTGPSRPPRRKEEPAAPFSLCDTEEFGRLSPDFSDMTLYNDIAQKSPRVQRKAAARREPTPGSEAERRQEGSSGPLFSELRQHQDSGFASPFYLQK